MAATCPTSSSTPRTSPVPCAPVLACGLELARSSTAFLKKILPLMAASAVRKTTNGELASSPAGLSSRKAITPFPSPAVFFEKNAKNCSVTERHRMLALPDVLAAGARHGLCGMILCHRLLADGTIFAPHIGSAFSSTKTRQRSRARHADRLLRGILHSV